MSCPTVEYSAAFTGTRTAGVILPDHYTIPEGADHITYTTTEARADGPVTGWTLAVRWLGLDTLPLNDPPGSGFFAMVANNITGVPAVHSWDIPTHAAFFQLELLVSVSGPIPVSTLLVIGEATFTGACVDPGYCTYGIETNPDAPIETALTVGIISLVVDAWLLSITGGAGIIWAAEIDTALGVLAGTTFVVDCATFPTPTPVSFTDIFSMGRDALLLFFRNISWNFF